MIYNDDDIVYPYLSPFVNAVPDTPLYQKGNRKTCIYIFLQKHTEKECFYGNKIQSIYEGA